MYGWLVPQVIFPLYERVSGRRFWTEALQLQELQWRSPEELEQRASVKLSRLLAHAALNVPYYRDLFKKAGVSPADIRTTADLAAIPSTNKADLRENFPERTTAVNLPVKRRWKSRTSGSSGFLFEFYTDRAYEDARFGAYLFSLGWAGVGPWDTRVIISSPWYLEQAANFPRASRLGTFARRLLLGEKTVRLSAPDLTVSKLVDLSHRWPRNYYFRVYPSYAAHLANDILRREISLEKYPTVVISMAENLTPANAKLVEQAFRCRVVNHYSCVEVPHIAQSCPDVPQVMHVNSERVILRLVRDDGQPAKPGERGRVLVTVLTNYVTPFINYDLGDYAVMAPLCQCGRGFPVLAAFDGRVVELIRTPTGRMLSPGSLERFMTFASGAVPYILEYQAVQVASDMVILRVVPTPHFNEVFRSRLQGEFADFLGTETNASVELVDRIPIEPSGKRLIIKSQMPYNG